MRKEKKKKVKKIKKKFVFCEKMTTFVAPTNTHTNMKNTNNTRTMNTTIPTTIHRTHAFDCLMAEARKCSPLTAESEKVLISLAKSGDKGAFESIIKGSLLFMVSVSAKFSTDGDTICELVSECAVGVRNAIYSYEYKKETRFLTYAVHYMRERISLYFEGNATIRNKVANNATKARKIANKYLAENGKEISEGELAEKVGTTNTASIFGARCQSLDTIVGEDGETLMEIGEVAMATASFNSCEKEIEQEHATAMVERVLAILTIKEQSIVKMYFGIGTEYGAMDYDAIAEEMDLTAERVRQIFVKAMAKLKDRGTAILAKMA